jgi:hypothetical protein
LWKPHSDGEGFIRYNHRRYEIRPWKKMILVCSGCKYEL